MRIALLTASISRNGAGVFEAVRRTSQCLHQEAEAHVEVLGVRDGPFSTDEALWQPVKPRSFQRIGPASFCYAPAMARELDQLNPDLAHTHGLWMYPSVAAWSWSKCSHRPHLVTPHGMLDPWALANSRWRKCIAGWLFENHNLRSAACLHALCESEAQAIRAFGLKNPIAIIPNGIDLPDLPRSTSDVQPPPWSTRLEAGKKVLLFLGRIHPKKGLVNLLKAWAAVARPPSSGFCPLSSDWALAIAGWDQNGHEAELKQLATELGMPWGDVREVRNTASLSAFSFQNLSILFLGPQFGEAKAVCYQNCDAFILPSFSEGLPMVVLEAWAHGKPVLMTPECNLPEGFTANAAVRIGPGSESIATSLEELFGAQPVMLDVLGQNGRTLVARRFTWRQVSTDLLGVYSWIVTGAKKPDLVTVC